MMENLLYSELQVNQLSKGKGRADSADPLVGLSDLESFAQQNR